MTKTYCNVMKFIALFLCKYQTFTIIIFIPLHMLPHTNTFMMHSMTRINPTIQGRSDQGLSEHFVFEIRQNSKYFNNLSELRYELYLALIGMLKTYKRHYSEFQIFQHNNTLYNRYLRCRVSFLAIFCHCWPSLGRFGIWDYYMQSLQNPSKVPSLTLRL